MQQLVQLTYSSVATHPFSQPELLALLDQSRKNNSHKGITGMLLYAENSFFQVLEGPPEVLDEVFSTISKDSRHEQLTIIIRETVHERSFADWTMGYAELSPEDADKILGANDVLTSYKPYTKLGSGRARKLLEAFKHGSWRAKLTDTNTPQEKTAQSRFTQPAIAEERPKSERPAAPERTDYTFAFQPIIDVSTRTIFSYEALIRGVGHEPASHVLKQIPASDLHRFDEESRKVALRMAAHLGLTTRINLNLLPHSIDRSPATMTALLDVAKEIGIAPSQIVIELLEREIVRDYDTFNEVINECRSAGVLFAIDDFGSGYAGLNLLAEFQPNLIKLDMNLIRDIQHKGPRQAIIRGIQRTSTDLGIDIIAEGVENEGEYRWLSSEGITLFQGNLFAPPIFEQLSVDIAIPG